MMRAVFSLLATAAIAISAYVALKWGLAHYSFQTPTVSSCHGTSLSLTKCLTDSVRAAVRVNEGAALRFAIPMIAGLAGARFLNSVGRSFRF
jgi:hypothetical protein